MPRGTAKTKTAATPAAAAAEQDGGGQKAKWSPAAKKNASLAGLLRKIDTIDAESVRQQIGTHQGKIDRLRKILALVEDGDGPGPEAGKTATAAAQPAPAGSKAPRPAAGSLVAAVIVYLNHHGPARLAPLAGDVGEAPHVVEALMESQPQRFVHQSDGRWNVRG